MSFKILLLLFLLTIVSCVTLFVPENNDNRDFLVVEGLITDQNKTNTIFLSRSAPLNSEFKKTPVSMGLITISDDLGNNFNLLEKKPGMYVTDSLNFRGMAGRKYILRILAEGFSYISDSMLMKRVPPIDTIHAEKILNESSLAGQVAPGYQVDVSTFDPTGQCGYYRWSFAETWEYKLPYDHSSIVNRVCWKSDISRTIFIKSTKSFAEDRVHKFPLNFISTETDRLAIKYSLLLKQYSLNEDEYYYWEKIKKINQETGGLYDVVPIAVKSNIKCVDDPTREVIGYFSVSAVSEKRLFVYQSTEEFPDFFKNCPYDTIPGWIADPRIGVSLFVIMRTEMPDDYRPYYVVTNKKSCHDCSLSGSKIQPDYWNSDRTGSIPRDNFDFTKMIK
jgi:hypothetical protein